MHHHSSNGQQIFNTAAGVYVGARAAQGDFGPAGALFMVLFGLKFLGGALLVVVLILGGLLGGNKPSQPTHAVVAAAPSQPTHAIVATAAPSLAAPSAATIAGLAVAYHAKPVEIARLLNLWQLQQETAPHAPIDPATIAPGLSDPTKRDYTIAWMIWTYHTSPIEVAQAWKTTCSTQASRKVGASGSAYTEAFNACVSGQPWSG